MGVGSSERAEFLRAGEKVDLSKAPARVVLVIVSVCYCRSYGKVVEIAFSAHYHFVSDYLRILFKNTLRYLQGLNTLLIEHSCVSGLI